MTQAWPLWECISARSLVELAQYQWLEYGAKLDIFPGSGDYTEQFFIESLVEIDKLMRQTRRHFKGTDVDY